MHQGAPYIISNIILTFMWMISANLILDNKYSKYLTVLLESVIQLVFWAVFELDIPLFTSIRLFSGIVCLCLLLHYFHTDKPAFKLITGLLIFVSSFLSEIILGTLVPYEMIVSGEIFAKYAAAVYSIYLLLNFTFLSLTVVALRSYKQRYQGLLVEKQWFLFFLFPLSQMIAMIGWWPAYLQFNTLGSPYKVVAMTVVSLLADAALIYAIWKTGASTELRIRSEMLEDQIRSQENYYDQLASTYSSVRKMRHDIDNHIYAIQALLDSNDTKSASDYIQKIQEQEHSYLPFSNCRNTVIASYLQKKAEDLKECGISLKDEVHLPVLEGISNPDLICIYGNILDNAKEACSKIPDAEITLKTHYKAPYLTISCQNPVMETNTAKQRRIPELERGLGFTILANLAKTYDGQFTYSSGGGLFVTEIILKDTPGE
ncbi:MAG: GHKL domain-containing protein [Solobacterium sp.]|nr:GHKL domain-containing protein [Solobacterium sp.]